MRLHGRGAVARAATRPLLRRQGGGRGLRCPIRERVGLAPSTSSAAGCATGVTAWGVSIGVRACRDPSAARAAGYPVARLTQPKKYGVVLVALP